MNEIEKQFKTAFQNFTKESNLLEVREADGTKNFIVKTEPEEDFNAIPVEIEDCRWGMPKFKTYITYNAEQDADVNGYIPDFVCGTPSLLFAIEIDGHEWHEKTKEQAAADKRRERALLKNHFIPVRFTGSEVYHNAMNCVKEVIEILAEFEYEIQFRKFQAAQEDEE